MEKKKNQTWGPLFCLIILVLDVLKLNEELSSASPDQTMVILYGAGVVIIIIALIFAVVKSVKAKKQSETK